MYGYNPPNHQILNYSTILYCYIRLYYYIILHLLYYSLTDKLLSLILFSIISSSVAVVD